MKKTLILCVLLSIFGEYALSQGIFSTKLEFTSSTSDFKAGTLGSFGASGSLSPGDPKGYAGAGIGIGLEYLKPIKVKGLYIQFGLNFYRNSIRSIIRRTFKANLDDGETVVFSAYYNIPVAVGAHYETAVTEDISMYAQLSGIYDFLKISKHSHTDDWGAEVWNREQRFRMSGALGFGVELGVILKEKYTIGLGYTKLGSHLISSTIDDELYYEGELQSGSWYTDTYTEVDQKNIMLLKLSLGLRF